MFELKFRNNHLLPKVVIDLATHLCKLLGLILIELFAIFIKKGQWVNPTFIFFEVIEFLVNLFRIFRTSLIFLPLNLLLLLLMLPISHFIRLFYKLSDFDI